MKLSELYAQLGAELIKDGDREVYFTSTSNVRVREAFVEVDGQVVAGNPYNTDKTTATLRTHSNVNINYYKNEVRFYLT